MSKLQQRVLLPHLMFDGEAEEALERYRKVFEVEVLQLRRYGPKMSINKEQQQKILHAEIKMDGNLVMLADCFEGTKSQQHPLLGLFMHYTDYKKAENTYNILSEGGNVEKPLQKHQLGGHSAKFRDKYGINWSLSCQEEPSKL